MPIYEYRCERCGDFEEMQRMSDPPLAKCPKCKRKVRRLISSTSFQLKGTGWYVTDYAKSGSSGAANGSKKDAGGDTAKSDSTSNGTTASKPETKSETKSESKSTTSTTDKSSS
jgi:putative FmdB family regulatory protein